MDESMISLAGRLSLLLCLIMAGWAAYLIKRGTWRPAVVVATTVPLWLGAAFVGPSGPFMYGANALICLSQAMSTHRATLKVSTVLWGLAAVAWVGAIVEFWSLP